MSYFLFDFSSDSNLYNWQIVNDVVMGGRSSSSIEINDEGNAVFSGNVSLENNGGFSMVRYRFEPLAMQAYEKLVLRIRGDGKRYQFRLKTNSYQRHSYVQFFSTNGEWQTIELSLADFYPAFRGRTLQMANYPGEELAEIAILIGNKKPEKFQLELDWLELK